MLKIHICSQLQMFTTTKTVAFDEWRKNTPSEKPSKQPLKHSLNYYDYENKKKRIYIKACFHPTNLIQQLQHKH